MSLFGVDKRSLKVCFALEMECFVICLRESVIHDALQGGGNPSSLLALQQISELILPQNRFNQTGLLNTNATGPGPRGTHLTKQSTTQSLIFYFCPFLSFQSFCPILFLEMSLISGIVCRALHFFLSFFPYSSTWFFLSLMSATLFFSALMFLFSYLYFLAALVLLIFCFFRAFLPLLIAVHASIVLFQCTFCRLCFAFPALFSNKAFVFPLLRFISLAFSTLFHPLFSAYYVLSAFFYFLNFDSIFQFCVSFCPVVW